MSIYIYIYIIENILECQSFLEMLESALLIVQSTYVTCYENGPWKGYEKKEILRLSNIIERIEENRKIENNV